MSSPPNDQGTQLQLFTEDALVVQPTPELVKQRSWWPIVIGLLLLGGLGWVLLNRLILPLWMMSQMKPPPPMAVPLSQAQSTTIENSSDYAATLDSRQSITVQPKVAGQIAAIFVKPGDPVRAGQKLVQIAANQQLAQVSSLKAGVNTANAELAAAKTDVTNAQDTLKSLQSQQAVAQANVQLNQADYRRYQSLFQAGATSKQSLDQRLNAIQTAQAQLNQAKANIQAQRSAIAKTQAQVARGQQAVAQAQANVFEGSAQLQDYTISAPFSGIVGNTPAKQGDVVSATTPLLTITQNDQLEVQLQIPLAQSAALRRGQLVKLLDERGQPQQSGQISFIAPNVDAASQSVPVKAIFANTGNKLRAAQFVNARVVWDTQPGLMVPTTAISRLGGKDFIFVAAPWQGSGCKAVAKGSGGPDAPTKTDPNQLVAVQKPIKLGKIVGNNQEILQGLMASDRLITTGILQLQNCLPISEATPTTAK